MKSIEHIATAIHDITEGISAQSEQDILPVYYDEQLANGAAFSAYRIKRFMNGVQHVAERAIDLTVAGVNHVAQYGGTGYFGEE